MLPTEDAAWVGEELARRFGVRAVELRADRDRRQPLGAAAVPRGDAAPVRARLQLLLPRVRRRDLRHARRRAAAVAGGQRRPGRRPDATTRGLRVQRPRRRRAPARRRAGRLRAGRARADQHRHRPARARLPRRRCARRATRTGTLLIIDETHTISAGPGGCTAAWGLSPDVVTIGKAIAGGIPIGAYGLERRAGRAHRGPRRRRPRRRRRRGRHAGRQRAVAGRRARHPRRGPHRRRRSRR